MTGEQDQLRDSVRRFLADKSPSAAVRQWMRSEAGFDPAVWRQLTSQLGLGALAEGGLAELAIVLEETGRALLPSPFFATVALAGQALAACGDERLLSSIVEGSRTATLAVSDTGRLEDVTITATKSGKGWTVSGTAMFVVDGPAAELVLVAARTSSGLGLFAVEDGFRRCPLDALDPTRRLGKLEFAGTPAALVGSEEALREAVDLAVIALAAEQVGGAQACLDMAVEYAKTRVQFGRPIGSFQAIKHKCADLLVEVDAARSAAGFAASCPKDERPAAAAAAGAYCSRVYTRAAKENIQIHGGIGYTWEHDAHLHLKRAKSAELLFGTPVAHRARLAGLAGI
ncbi:acyl-CoA dehydrogenase family protein [Amycolatopsis acidicola]|uniref:acyl-CoA dehydrogenase family protein n=1 Tax=Amycolatopsis acidicola TaxID=2596893 RepID=UPI003C7DC95D